MKRSTALELAGCVARIGGTVLSVCLVNGIQGFGARLVGRDHVPPDTAMITGLGRTGTGGSVVADSAGNVTHGVIPVNLSQEPVEEVHREARLLSGKVSTGDYSLIDWHASGELHLTRCVVDDFNHPVWFVRGP